MDVHSVQLAVVLLLNIYTDQGNAQVNCYADSPCEGPELLTDVTPHTCCMLDAAVAFQSGDEGEVCEKCLIYGWIDTFPIEVKKGQVVNLEVGYIKGTAAIRRRVMVEYDDSEVTVEPDDFQLISSAIIQTVQVTVLDDGLPITEDKTITLTLTFSGIDTDDVFLDEALLIIPARQVTPVRVGLESPLIEVAESDGSTSVCVSAMDIGSNDITVTLSATPGTAQSEDYSFNSPTPLQLNSNTTTVCVAVDITADGLYENSPETFTIQLTTTADNVDIVQNATEIIVFDSDEAVIVVEPTTVTVTEGDTGRKTVCLSMSNAAIPVNVTFSGEYSEDVIDFGLQKFIILQPNGIPTCIEYMIVDDDEMEGTEVIEVEWYGVESERIQPASFRLTITDNDAPPPIIPIPPTPPSDVVSGGALLTALINARSKDLQMDMSLCYEVHGEPGQYFNFISGPCLSVNAHYFEADADKPLNNIDEIAVVATNGRGENVNLLISAGCELLLNGSDHISFLNSSGILSSAASDTVVISTDSAYCGGDQLLLVVGCDINEYGLMQLNVYRELVLQNTAFHGLLGQFWSKPIFIERFGSDPGDYLIEIPFSGNQRRRLVGSDHTLTWQRRRALCLYAGDRQGGKGAGQHGGPNEPVLEGVYTDYITDGPFDTSFEFSQFGQ